MPRATNIIDLRISFMFLLVFVALDRCNAVSRSYGDDVLCEPCRGPATRVEGNATDTLADSPRLLRRGKRYLDFLKGTRISWRLVVKHSILKVNSQWGYNYGIRTNYPIPAKEDRRRPLFKRHLLDSMAGFLDGHGFDGRACVLKSYCSTQQQGEQSGRGAEGMFFKLLKFLFTMNLEDKKFLHYLNAENCQQILYTHCPLSFDHLSPFTDTNY